MRLSARDSAALSMPTVSRQPKSRRASWCGSARLTISERPESISSRKDSRFSVLPRLWRSTGDSVSRSARLRVDSFMWASSLPHWSILRWKKRTTCGSVTLSKQLLSEVLVGEEVGKLRQREIGSAAGRSPSA